MPRLQSLLFIPVLLGSLAVVSASHIHDQPASCPVNQYLAKYYNNLTHAGTPALTRCEYSAGAAWDNNSPAPGVRSGNFSVVYTGSIDFPITGDYNWNANTNDVAVQVTLDDAPVINEPSQTFADHLVSGTVNNGVHTIRVAVVDSARDGEEEFSISPVGTGVASRTGNYFAEDSFFNQRIPPRAAIDPRTSSWVNLIYHDPEVDAIVFNDDAYTVPIYKAAAGTPAASIFLTNTNQHITIPYAANYRPSPDEDAHLAVIDTTNGCEYEFQSFDPRSMSALAEATYHAYTGSGGHVSDPGHSGGELSYIGGLITPQDVNAGVIRHALRYAIPDNTWTFTYPGTRSDGTVAGGVPEGTLMQLDPNLDLKPFHLSPFQLMVARALQTYGAYDADKGGAFALYAESTTDGSTYSQPFDALPKALIKSLRFLAPRTPSTAVQLAAANDKTCQQPK